MKNITMSPNLYYLLCFLDVAPQYSVTRFIKKNLKHKHKEWREFKILIFSFLCFRSCYSILNTYFFLKNKLF